MTTDPFHRLSVLAASSVVALAAACTAPSSTTAGGGVEVSTDRSAPVLADATLIHDTARGETTSFDRMLDELAAVDVVFLGETHLDDTTHRFELAVLEGLFERTGGRVVMSMEMFERDVQPALDDYLAGRVPEREFRQRARPWGNYATGYRPLIEFAKNNGVPVVAANTPARLRRQVSMGGADALAGLSAEDRALLPPELLPTSAAYWERVDRAVRGHLGSSGQPPEARVHSSQSLWDNSMGQACAEALRSHPGHVVLHVVGGFHVSHRQGTVEQLLQRAPDARVAVVSVSPTADFYSVQPERYADRADYLVYALSIARGRQGATHAVTMPAELRYHLDVPAAGDGPFPLLVWLHDDGERAVDARARWREVVGDEAVIATVIAPYREVADDLAVVGRWAQADTFREDHGQLEVGLERLVDYVTRRFAIDPERVTIAGHGRGATAVLWCGLYSSWLGAAFTAIEPRDVNRLRQEGLPEQRSAASRVLVVAAAPSSPVEPSRPSSQPTSAPTSRPANLPAEPDPWEGLRKDFEDLGIQFDVVDAWPQPAAVRVALGLAPPAPQISALAEGPRTLLALEDDRGARARTWAILCAQAVEKRAGGACAVVTPDELMPKLAAWRRHGEVTVRPLRFGGEPLDLGAGARSSEPWRPDDVREGRGLPLAPGDFGGTTVLVLPPTMRAAERAAWQQLEEDEPLRKRSRFASLRVAGGARSLREVLQEIRESGRRNVLVVPAAFCVDADTMRAMRAGAGLTDGLDIAWLPGLGAEAAALLR